MLLDQLLRYLLTYSRTHLLTISSPTRHPHAGDQTAVCQFAETNPANAELAVYRARPAAQLAAALAPSAEFGNSIRFGDFRFAGHRMLIP